MSSSNPPPHPDAQDKWTMSVGIDFGTTYSGISCLLSHPTLGCERHEPRGFLGPPKIPTRVTTDANRTFHLHDETASTVPLLEWFKLSLLHPDDLPSDVRDSRKFRRATEERERLNLTAVDVTGAYLKLLWDQLLFSLYTKYPHLRPLTITNITATLPAVWPVSARQRLREAIEKAGILSGLGRLNFNFLSEPEAAAVALLPHNGLLSKVRDGDTLIVYDCGGGTTDSIAYRVLSRQPIAVEECIPGKCIFAGAALLDDAFTDLLRAKVGAVCPGPTLSAVTEVDLKSFARQIWDQGLKLDYSEHMDDQTFPLPFAMVGSEARRAPVGSPTPTITFSRVELGSVFNPIVDKILRLVSDQMLHIEREIDKAPDYVIVAGGFGRNNYLQTRIIQQVSAISLRTRVISYAGGDLTGWLSVMQGGALHSMRSVFPSPLSSLEVSSRVSRATYGVQSGPSSIKWLVHKGQSLSNIRSNQQPLPTRAYSVAPSLDGQIFTLDIFRKNEAAQGQGPSMPVPGHHLAYKVRWMMEARFMPDIQDGDFQLDARSDGEMMDFAVSYRGIEIKVKIEAYGA